MAPVLGGVQVTWHIKDCSNNDNLQHAQQVFGGLIVGMVVKYADNILKNFANALSVILTVIGAAPLFGQYPSPWFIVGAAAVTLSVYMYSQAALPVCLLAQSPHHLTAPISTP